MSRRFFSIQRLSIRTKLLLGLSAVIICLGVSLGLIGTHIASTELIKENKERGRVLAASLAYRSEEPLLARDFLRLKNLVDEVREANSDVAYAFILDPAGQVLMHTFEQGFPVQLLDVYDAPVGPDKSASMLLITDKGKIHDFVKPVTLKQDRLGTVRIGMHRKRLEEMIQWLSFGFSGSPAGSRFSPCSLSPGFHQDLSTGSNV